VADFIALNEFLPKGKYSLLPFDFARLTGDYLLVNLSGEFLRLGETDFFSFVQRELTPQNPCFWDLMAKHFIFFSPEPHYDLLASKYRTKKAFLEGFTKLHIFVPTIRCNQSCQYCQVSRHGEASGAGSDMSVEVLHKSVDMMLGNPAPMVTMEFQGGEPLLRFDLIKEGVLYTKERNKAVGKSITFVICTNLTLLNDEHLFFFKKHNVQISTSLDGPAELHNKNRPLGMGDKAHVQVCRNIRRVQEALGKQSVSALMTTSRESLKYPKEIVNEYLALDMHSLFIRELNPYGYAVKARKKVGYSIGEFLAFYEEMMNYIIQINREGRTFMEAYTSLVLTKILTPWTVGFVDLQSPAGAGIGVAIYNYDGDVYPSDESRMLAEMGDTTLRMGNVMEDSYENIFFGETMQVIALSTCNEALAGCADCVYHIYCGADPIRNYATQGDCYGHRPSSDFCHKNMGIIKYAFKLIAQAEKDKDLSRILWAWITRDDVNRMDYPIECTE